MATLPSHEAEIVLQRVMDALHDAIVHRPGGPRFATLAGRHVKPLGSRLAGELIGMPSGYVRSLLSPGCEKHNVNLKHLVAWLMAGMDPAPLDELEAAIGRVAFPIPECDGNEGLHIEAVRIGKEVGDVFNRLREITDPEGDGGVRITRREAESIEREAREACASLMALVQAVREQAE